MSMNLAFDVKGGGTVKFPYQTSTSLSHRVVNAATIDDQIKLIADDLANIDDEQWRESILREVEMLLRNPNLELIVI